MAIDFRSGVIYQSELMMVRLTGSFEKATGFHQNCYEMPMPIIVSETKAEKNQARLKELRGRAGRWA